MLLTDHEKHVLRTFDGRRYESKQIRERLHEAGLRYCKHCDSVKPDSTFGKNLYACKRCGAAVRRKYYAVNKEDIARRSAVYRRLNMEASVKAPATDPAPELLDDSSHFDFEDDL